MSNQDFLSQNSPHKHSIKKSQRNSSYVQSQKHTLFVRKLNLTDKNLINSRNIITKEIDNFFNSPDAYFSNNNPVSIGKKTEINEMGINIEKKLRKRTLHSIPTKKSSKVLNKSLTSNSNTRLNQRGNTNVNSNKLKSEKTLNNPIDNPNFEIIDNTQLNDIFRSFEDKKDFNNNSFYELNQENNTNLPVNISSSLNDQEKKLYFNKSVDKKFKNISKYLSRKINKNEKDLLLNQIDSYLYKNEALRSADKTKLENFNWSISLRRPENFQGVRKSYINISTDKNPIWGIVIEKSPKQKEMAVKADSELNDNFKNYIDNYKDLKVGGSLRFLKKLDTLSVKGKNLLKCEYDREMSSSGKKILHKVFMDNGKLIFKNDVNNLFGDETFYKNYEKPCKSYRNTLALSYEGIIGKTSNTERGENNKYNIYRE